MIISERIFYVMEQKNITQLELSRRTGIATSNISDWKKKKTNPKADCLLSICDALDITPEQLLTGKGIDPEYKDADMDYEVTRADIKILKQIHSLGDEQRHERQLASQRDEPQAVASHGAQRAARSHAQQAHHRSLSFSLISSRAQYTPSGKNALRHWGSARPSSGGCGARRRGGPLRACAGCRPSRGGACPTA